MGLADELAYGLRARQASVIGKPRDPGRFDRAQPYVKLVRMLVALHAAKP
jgi:hypothetical protein